MVSLKNTFLMSIAVLVVLGLALMGSLPAWAVSYHAGRLATNHQDPYRPVVEPLDPGMGWLAIKGYGRPHRFINRVIADENWDVWVQFQRSPVALIPVVPIIFYKIYSVKLPMEIERGEVGPPPPKRRTRDLTGLNLLVSVMPPNRRDIIPRAKDPLNEGSPWTPVSWLFEGDGLFSPEPWAAENFIPRAIAIMILVLGGIAIIEVMRIVVRLGVRVIVSGRRGSGRNA